jgi:hypothetical protein
MLWIFTWDDEIDMSTSDLFSDLDRANKFREETYHFVRYTLGMGDSETSQWNFAENKPKGLLIRSFDVIGAGLRRECSNGKG